MFPFHNSEELEYLDKQFIWHPFTQMMDWLDEEPLIVAAGEGSYLIDVHGHRYLDGGSSLWVNVHGHRRAEIDQAVIEQLNRIAHSAFLGLSNIPAIQLAKELAEITPPSLVKVFYSDNGSTGVEIALKMAFQYWQQCQEPQPRPALSPLSMATTAIPSGQSVWGELTYSTRSISHCSLRLSRSKPLTATVAI